MQWRRNVHLLNYIEQQGIYAVALSPDPLTMDGQLFDPREHFRAWREAEEAAMARLQRGRHSGPSVRAVGDSRGTHPLQEYRRLSERAWHQGVSERRMDRRECSQAADAR